MQPYYHIELADNNGSTTVNLAPAASRSAKIARRVASTTAKRNPESTVTLVYHQNSTTQYPVNF